MTNTIKLLKIRQKLNLPLLNTVKILTSTIQEAKISNASKWKLWQKPKIIKQLITETEHVLLQFFIYFANLFDLCIKNKCALVVLVKFSKITIPFFFGTVTI